MYFDNLPIAPLTRNIALVSSRNTGKTSTLKRFLTMYREAGYTVVVIDSATDHADRSIVKYIENHLDGVLTIGSPERHEIVRSHRLWEDNLDIRGIYPYEILKANQKSLIAVDVGRYLEEGYGTDDLQARASIRQYYKELVLQVLYVVEQLYGAGRVAVVMDEIEFVPEMEWMVSRLNNRGIFFINAIHNKDSLGKSGKLFDICGD